MSRDKIILENETRNKIYKHILEYPGVSFSKLKRFHELNDGTLRYHLNYLVRAEKIKSKIENGKLHYYPHTSSGELSNQNNINSKYQDLTPNQELILTIIKQNPGINQRELISRASLKRHILAYNISQLIERGMIKKNNHVKFVTYEYLPDDLLQYEMLKMLTIKFLNNEIDEETFIKLKKRLE